MRGTIRMVPRCLIVSLDDLSDPSASAALGRLLLLLSGLIVCAGFGLLRPTMAGVRTLVGVSAVLLAAVLLSVVVPWPRLPRSCTLAFPLLMLGGLAAIGAADQGDAFAFSALITFCFVFVGLTQEPWASVPVIPPAAVAWILANRPSNASDGIRLVIAISIWLTIGEVLAHRSGGEARSRRSLLRQTHTDPLTGLLNRRGLEEAIGRVDCTEATVVLCDLDHFKVVNDTEGHLAGDEILRNFGQLLTDSLRGQDVACRFGGEEFLLILVDTTPEAAVDVLARMRARWAGYDSAPTFSSGVAEWDRCLSVHQAAARADNALYRSKSAGRNCDHIDYHTVTRASS